MTCEPTHQDKEWHENSAFTSHLSMPFPKNTILSRKGILGVKQPKEVELNPNVTMKRSVTGQRSCLWPYEFPLEWLVTWTQFSYPWADSFDSFKIFVHYPRFRTDYSWRRAKISQTIRAREPNFADEKWNWKRWYEFGLVVQLYSISYFYLLEGWEQIIWNTVLGHEC